MAASTARTKMADSRGPWVFAVAGLWVNICLMGVYRSSAVIFVAFLEAMDVTRKSATWPLALQAFFLCATGPLAGFLNQHFSGRVVLFCGCSLVATGTALCYFAGDIVYITLFYGIFPGIGYGLMVPTLQVVMNQHFNQFRATAVGFVSAGTAVGAFVMPPLVDWMLRTHGLRGAFLLLGGIAIQALPGAALLRPPASRSPDRPSPDGKTPPQPDRRRKRGCVAETADILTHPMFLVITLSYCLSFLSSFCYLTVIVDFATDRDIPEEASPFIISAVGAGGLASRLCIGWVSDRLCVARWHVVATSMAAMGPLLATVPLASDYTALVAPAVLIGLLYGVVSIHISVMLREYFGLERLSLAIGCSNLFIGLATFVRPTLIGHFRDEVGSYDGLFVTVGALQIVAALLWLLEPLVRGSDSVAARLARRCAATTREDPDNPAR